MSYYVRVCDCLCQSTTSAVYQICFTFEEMALQTCCKQLLVQWTYCGNGRLLATQYVTALQKQYDQRHASSYKCVVLGGGAGGCAMAAKMSRTFGAGNVAVIEPNDVSLLVAALSISYLCHDVVSQHSRFRC